MLTGRFLALVVAGLLGTSVLPAHGGPLIQPTGMWGVGRTSMEVVDRSRTMPGSSEPRRLMLRIWYPTDTPGSPGPNLPYMEGLDRARASLTAEELGLLERTETHSKAVAPAATSERFPVLLFSHGEQTNVFLYSNLHEDLASRGYVVVGVDHPGAALFVAYPDGFVATYSEAANLSQRAAERALDLRFMLGGPASAPSRPFMYVTKPFRTLSDAELLTDNITREEATSTQASTWARDGRLLSDAGPPSYRVTFHHAEHSSFSDEPLLLDAEDANSSKLMTRIRDVVAQFFDATLAGTGQSPVPTSDHDIEVEVLAREAGSDQ